jgi:hypothetical protein
LIKHIKMVRFESRREFSLAIEARSQILRAKYSHTYCGLVMFLLTEDGSPVEPVKFRCYRTGETFDIHPADRYEHVSTFWYFGSEWHLFRVHQDAGEWPPGPAPDML